MQLLTKLKSLLILLYRANEWNLNAPDWTGRLRLVEKKGQVFIKLEDRASGQLFAQCPIESYPGVAVEAVSDSSRYFVMRIQDDNGEEYIELYID